MIFTEWNWDDAIAVAKEEAFEDGIGKGVDKRSNEVLTLIRKGYSSADIEKFLLSESKSTEQ